MNETTINPRKKEKTKKRKEELLIKKEEQLAEDIAKELHTAKINEKEIELITNKIMYKILTFTIENKYYDDIILHRECKKYFNKCRAELIQKIP